MSEDKIFKIKNEWVKEAYVNSEEYEKKYKESINENEFFWDKEGKRIDWIRQYTKIKDVKFSNKDVKIKLLLHFNGEFTYTQISGW